MDLPALERLASAWLADDPDPDTRAELESLLASDDQAALAERFGTRLEFGTAGLRGALGAGPNRMNRVVVRRAAAGVAAHLGAGNTVVVGHDARHKSDLFALDTARVLAGAGLRVRLLPPELPTPVLAFAVRHLGADAGVMVTASHNPPGDNGYKVYGRDGAQIVPPVDAEIGAALEERGTGSPVLADHRDPGIERVGQGVVEDYLAFAATSVERRPRDLTIVYTPLHGVGGQITTALFARLGFDNVRVVAEQADADADFPTVRLPNPEETGALDLALDLAGEVGAGLILAHDPDADRLGVAVFGGERWRLLTGDEVGVLLADHLLASTQGDDRLVVNSVVSSRQLARMAARHGVHHLETLTGFKWIVRPGLLDPSLRFVFGYEEALGYSVREYVRDKDGITAAVVFADLAASLAGRARTVLDRLDELAELDGLHLSRSWSFRDGSPEGPARIRELMGRVRSVPPDELVGRAVERVIDFGECTGADVPGADLLDIRLAGDDRVLIRPSGTEPKLKVYAQATRAFPTDAGARRRARAEVERDLEALLAAVRGFLSLG